MVSSRLISSCITNVNQSLRTLRSKSPQAILPCFCETERARRKSKKCLALYRRENRPQKNRVSSSWYYVHRSVMSTKIKKIIIAASYSLFIETYKSYKVSFMRILNNYFFLLFFQIMSLVK